MQNEHDNNAIPDRLMPFLDAVQTDAIQRQPCHQLPYSKENIWIFESTITTAHQLRHIKDVIVEALELGLVGVFDANTGHAHYCQQATKNMTNPNK